MDKKALEQFLEETYTKYLQLGFSKFNLYLGGKLTKKELDEELEVLMDACYKELNGQDFI